MGRPSGMLVRRLMYTDDATLGNVRHLVRYAADHQAFELSYATAAHHDGIDAQPFGFGDDDARWRPLLDEEIEFAVIAGEGGEGIQRGIENGTAFPIGSLYRGSLDRRFDTQ